MSTNPTAIDHVIKFRDKSGQWHTIPVVYQTIYNAYVEYCQSQKDPIDPIDMHEFYNVFTILTRSELIKNIINNSYNDVLPIEAGGTGASSAEAARTKLEVYSKQDIDNKLGNSGEDSIGTQLQALQAFLNEVDTDLSRLTEDLNEVQDKVNSLPNNIDLAAVGISVGTDEPNSNTKGMLYFRYIQ